MRIDAHQHFWKYNAAEYPWIPPQSPLQRDRLPEDLAPLLAAAGIDGSIAVQARQTVDETRWLLELAEPSALIKGVVGWIDLRSAGVARQLDEFARRPKFRGVRHVAQDEPDDRFLVGTEFMRGISLLSHFGLTYDLLVFPRQLPAAIELARRFPAQPFVLDHIAKPPIKTAALSPWREQIIELARWPNVWCKVSGLVTEADHRAWKPGDFSPYLDVVFEAFGAERVMYGSDWPVCLLAATYEQQQQIVKDYVSRLSRPDQEKVFGGNAARFYLR